MNAYSARTIADQLNVARLAISNTLTDDEIAALVAKYGYGQARLQEGKELYEAALAAVNAQSIAAGLQRQATAQARSAEAGARASYQGLAQLARALFPRNAPERTTLGLVGKAPQGTAAFLSAAHALFDNALALPEIAAALASYGYDAGQIGAARAAIAAFDQANQAQVAALGAAQLATRAQSAALDALGTWVTQYLKIAKIALRDQPERIEKIGGVVRSTRTAAQRAAPRKAAATRAARREEGEPAPA